MALSPRARVLVIATLLFGAIGGLVWFLSSRYRTEPVTPLELPRETESITPPSLPSPSQTVAAIPVVSPTPTPTPGGATPQFEGTPRASSTPASPLDPGLVQIPVAGVKPEQLRDTYNDARSEGRVHNAIDIIAPRGTPVLAFADGRIIRLLNSEKGGNTLYQISTDEKLVYYYAHLDSYADGLKEGHFARRGETIAFVGDTGNATPGNYHLHFQVYLITDPKHFWNGENLNPYDLLRTQ